MKAVSSDVTPVLPDEYGCFCSSGCGPAVFRSEFERLCKLLFGNIPLGMDPERQIPNIEIWEEGVIMERRYLDGGTAVYEFTVEDDDRDPNPKRADVIFYNGRFYIIGEVKTIGNPYLEIEPEVIWVNPEWAVDNNVYSNLTWNVK